MNIEFINIPSDTYKLTELKTPFEITAFEISKHLITYENFNEYLEQVEIEPSSTKFKQFAENELYKVLPVVDINLEEAENFCSWLGETLNCTITLPTKLEWEAAARGTDGLLYPWGEDFEMNNCSSLDAGSMSSTPIGSFPNGASPFGLLDMVGNVWQWTTDFIDDEVIIKGGCWMDSSWGLRTNRDLLADPNLRTNNTGFRIVKKI
jgi:formylglycine-generating enzyme required for sulfatase activity